MTLSHSVFSLPIQFTENQLQTLVIENKPFYQQCVQELLAQLDGEEGEFSLYEGDKKLNFAKSVDLVTDIFQFEVNQTKYLTKLYHQIQAQYAQTERYSKTVQVSSEIVNFLNDIVAHFEYQLEYDSQFDLVNLLKAQKLKFVFEGKSILEKLLDYMQILTDFYQMKLFILPNLKTVLSTQELELFYQAICYRKIRVLLLETSVIKADSIPEQIRIIDQDLCVID